MPEALRNAAEIVDLAFKPRDFTVHIVVALDSEGRMYVVDLWRKQATSDVWIETLCDLVQKWRPSEWGEETGQIKSGVGPFLFKRMIERGICVYRRQFPTRGDKAVRAQSIRGRMAMKGLYLPAGASWVPEFQRELLTFPAGAHDDQVDALGLIGQLLDHIQAGRKPEEKTARPTEVIYEVQPDGRVVANMSVREIVELKMRKKRLEA